jgi:tripartite-type tricarboxylate transporter receptor subunit TctC
MFRPVRAATAMAALAASGLAAQPAAADPVADFYKGRQVTLIVAYPSGGMYGITSQLITRHIGKHIPGNPTIVPQYMPGAGGTKGANYVYNAAPRDGSFLAVLSKDVAVTQKLRPKAIKYKADEFAYFGRVLPYTAVLMLWHGAGVTQWEQLKSKPVIIGSSGKSSHEFMEAMLLNHVAGMKIKVVHGYGGAGGMYKAMETGEIHGRIGAWGSLKTLKKHWLDKKQVFAVMQTGLSRAGDLKDIPAIIEMARNDEERQMFEVMEAGGPVGWGLQGPPKMPAAFTPALRKAFNAMVKDPAFVADVAKRKVDLDPATGEEVEAVVKRTLAIPAIVVAKMRKIAGL